jgi:Ni/Fe-hydrogenase 1 B-type cytochrome subunit
MTAAESPLPAMSAASERAPHGEAASPEAGERIRIYVWQVPVRVTHWVTAACIVVLSVTGGYIADPFLIPPGGSVMTTVRLVHMITAFTLVASLLVRLAWMVVGNRFARWSAFIPTTRFQATEIFRQAAFYAFLRKEIPKVLGHNQLAAAAYVLLFVLLFVETVTGFALDALQGTQPWATMFGWVLDLLGTQLVRVIHHLSMWAILAIALFHVYSSVLVDHLEKNGLISSIFSGFKFPTREEVLESRDGGAELIGPDE